MVRKFLSFRHILPNSLSLVPALEQGRALLFSSFSLCVADFFIVIVCFDVRFAILVQGLGLTLEQRTDPKFLRKELDNLNKQWKELSLAHKTRYRPKDAKLNLKEQLALKVQADD